VTDEEIEDFSSTKEKTSWYMHNCTKAHPPTFKLFTYSTLFRLTMKVEVERFHDGDLKLLVRFEPSGNFWKADSTWVPTFEEIERILETLLGVDVINRWKKNRRNTQCGDGGREY